MVGLGPWPNQRMDSTQDPKAIWIGGFGETRIEWLGRGGCKGFDVLRVLAELFGYKSQLKISAKPTQPTSKQALNKVSGYPSQGLILIQNNPELTSFFLICIVV